MASSSIPVVFRMESFSSLLASPPACRLRSVYVVDGASYACRGGRRQSSQPARE